MKKFLWSFVPLLTVAAVVYASEITVGPFTEDGSIDAADINAIITGADDTWDQVVTNTADIATNSSNISALDVTALTARVVVNEADISTNESDITTNASGVSANDTAIGLFEAISGLVKVSGGTPAAAVEGTDYFGPNVSGTVDSDIEYVFGSGEGALKIEHVSADNAVYLTPYDGGAWATAKQLVYDADTGDWLVEGSLNVESVTVGSQEIIDSSGNVVSTGVLQGRVNGRVLTTTEDLDADDLNSWIDLNLATTATFGIPDCTADISRSFITLWVVNATHQAVLYPIDSDDLFRLADGTDLDAGDELDLSTTGNQKHTLMCAAETPGTWKVIAEDGTSADGGAHSY